MRFSTSKQLHINDHLKAHLGYKSCPKTLGTEELVYGGTRTHDLVVENFLASKMTPECSNNMHSWTNHIFTNIVFLCQKSPADFRFFWSLAILSYPF